MNICMSFQKALFVQLVLNGYSYIFIFRVSSFGYNSTKKLSNTQSISLLSWRGFRWFCYMDYLLSLCALTGLTWWKFLDENGEVLPCIRCKRCTLRHCSCDECRISHIITCGLLIDSEDISDLIWVRNLSSNLSPFLLKNAFAIIVYTISFLIEVNFYSLWAIALIEVMIEIRI